MQPALKVKTTVLPGHRIELSAPQLPEGEEVEVFITLPELANGTSESIPTQGVWDFIQSLPPGPRSADSWEEIERRFREERDSWDR